MRHFIIFCFCFFLSFSPAKADIFGFDNTIDAADALLEQRIDQFFQNFNQTADELLAKGRSEGSLLLLQAGNEMKLASATAIQALGAQLDQTIGELGDKATVAFARMDQIQRDVEDGLASGRDFADLMTISIESIAAQLPFAEDAPFYIRRVDGLVVPYTPSATGHSVDLTGPGFGGNADGVETTFNISIDGKPFRVQVHGSGTSVQAVFKLPRSWIEQHRNRSELKTHSLRIEAIRSEPKWPKWLRGEHVKTAQMDLELILLPQLIGQLVVEQEIPIYDWQALASTDVITEDVRAPKSVNLPLPSPDLDGIPTPGEMKWDRSSFKSSCKNNYLPHRKFDNGKLVLATDPLFSSGWKATKNPKCNWIALIQSIGVGNNQAFKMHNQGTQAQLVKNAKEFKSIFGSSKPARGYWENLRRSKPKENTQCHSIPASVLKAISKPLSHDVTGCRTVKVDRHEFRNRDTNLVVHFKGSAKVKGLWTLSAQRLTFSDTGQTEVITNSSVDVTTDAVFHVDVQSTPGNRGVIDLKLHSKIVPDVSFTLNNPPPGLRLLNSQELNSKVRRFSFAYELPL